VPLVRASAASALGRIKSRKAVEPLERLAGDESPLVRRTASAVLRGFGAP
jgi:HEAT repeat protein